MNRIQKIGTYAALLGALSLPLFVLLSKQDGTAKQSQQEISSNVPATQEYENVSKFKLVVEEGDNPWKLSRITYGSGASSKKLISDNYSNKFNPTRDMHPGTILNIYLTNIQAEKFWKLYPRRTLVPEEWYNGLHMF